MRKVIINTSNLQKGGALQIALSFVNMASMISGIQFHIILGKATSKVINVNNYDTYSNMSFSKIDFHPSESLLKYFLFKRELSKIEQRQVPDGVISVFGPIYWKPKTKHILGFANGYYIYEDSPFFQVWDGHKSYKYKLKKIFHRLLLKHEAKLYWVETEDSRKRLSKFLNINIDNIVVATNNANENFEHKKNYELSDSKLPSDNFKLLFISGYYVHKNHKFIVEVDSKLKEKNYTVDFIVTLEDKDFKQINPSGIKNIINVGQLLPHQCPLYYRLSDAVFMPSLIETFTAVYPEAMISERPIITSNLSFAKNLCGPAALFYNYDSASSAADCIIQLINDKNLYNSLVEQGKSQVKLFDTPKERFKKVLNHLIKG